MMSRKDKFEVAMVIVAVSGLSALIAYRIASKQAGNSLRTPRASAKFAAPCVEIDRAASHVGEETCIAGRLLRVFTSKRGHTFLDFCADYRNCPFTSVIFADDRSKFGDLDSLKGRTIEIEGLIREYQGRAEIIIHGPEQIRTKPE